MFCIFLPNLQTISCSGAWYYVETDKLTTKLENQIVLHEKKNARPRHLANLTFFEQKFRNFSRANN